MLIRSELVPRRLGELWMTIFSKLELPDLCRVSLVNKTWHLAASSPFLWTNLNIPRRKLVVEGYLTLLEVPRYTMVRRLDLSMLWIKDRQWEELLTQVVLAPPLLLLNLSHGNLAGVPSHLLASVITHSKTTRLCNLQQVDWLSVFQSRWNKVVHVVQAQASQSTLPPRYSSNSRRAISRVGN